MKEKDFVEKHYRLQNGCFFTSFISNSCGLFTYCDTIRCFIWNHSFPSLTSDSSINTFIDDTILFYRSRNRTPCIYLDDSSNMDDIKSQLLARGFRDADREVWLKDEQRVISKTKSVLHGFEISIVQTENELAQFLEICTDCFGKEYSDAISMEFFRYQPHKRFSHFIGYRSGHAVAIGSFYSDGTVTVFHNIGVRNEFRNNGFGKAMVNSLCNEHNQILGYIPLFLQCDGNGFHEKFYNDLGFETFYIRHGYTLDEAGGNNNGG